MPGMRRALRRPVHAGHGGARDLSGRGRRLGAAGRRSGSRHDGGARARRPCARPARRSRSAPIEKMSKSKKNTVDPDDIIATYGADTARWFMLSDSPPERDVIWTEEGVQGAAPLRAAALAPGRRDRRRRHAPRRRRPRRRGSAPQALADPQGRAPRAGRGRGGHRAPALQPLRGACSTSSPTRSAPRSARSTRADAARRTSAWAFREAGRHPRAAARPDDAASGRGMLAGARATRASSADTPWPVARPRRCSSRTRSPCRSRSTARSAPT